MGGAAAYPRPDDHGWKVRDFYLDHTNVPYLFDSAGNAAPTAWWGGRIVGTWVQDEAARVHVISRGTLPVLPAGRYNTRQTALPSGTPVNASAPYAQDGSPRARNYADNCRFICERAAAHIRRSVRRPRSCR